MKITNQYYYIFTQGTSGDKLNLSMTKPEISDFLRKHPYWSYQKKPLTALEFLFRFQGRLTFCRAAPYDS